MIDVPKLNHVPYIPNKYRAFGHNNQEIVWFIRWQAQIEYQNFAKFYLLRQRWKSGRNLQQKTVKIPFWCNSVCKFSDTSSGICALTDLQRW